MHNLAHWLPGDIIVMRGIWKGKLWWACPAYIVQDSVDRLAIYWRVGTPVRRWVRRPTIQDLLIPDIQLIDAQWTETDVLSLIMHGAGHSIDIMWETGHRTQRCWYVHLQEPLRRTPIGFDTMDQILDIVISPDCSQWHWKDEDEFSEAVTTGIYSHAKAKAIRVEGERVIAMLNANASPFCDGWENWFPPTDWTIPTFPEGWEGLPLKKTYP